MNEEIKLNGITYIPKDSNYKQVKKDTKGLEYCIVRTFSAGVFAGWYDRKTKGQEGTIFNVRRIWYWAGAMSLSQLSVDGTNEPKECKFTVINSEIDLKEIIEILPCTEKAKTSIENVKIWEI